MPEGSKKDVTMVEFIQNLLLERMELYGAEDIEIMRAHCMPVTVRKDAPNSDSQHILANAEKCFKNNQYKGSFTSHF